LKLHSQEGSSHCLEKMKNFQFWQLSGVGEFTSFSNVFINLH
jgi:hypothetical protein